VKSNAPGADQQQGVEASGSPPRPVKSKAHGGVNFSLFSRTASRVELLGGQDEPGLRRRLAQELALVTQHDLASYLLAVHESTAEARRRGSGGRDQWLERWKRAGP
jgi:hypothetical protein